MSNALKFVPPRVPLCEPGTGFITREWFLFLQGVFVRVGGANGLSTTDVDAGSFAAMQPATTASDLPGEVMQGLATDAAGLDVMQADQVRQFDIFPTQ